MRHHLMRPVTGRPLLLNSHECQLISTFSSIAAAAVSGDIDDGTKHLLLTIDSLQMAINLYGSQRLQFIANHYMEALGAGILSQAPAVKHASMNSPEPKSLQPIFSETTVLPNPDKPGHYTYVSANTRVQVFQGNLGLKGAKWQLARLFFF